MAEDRFSVPPGSGSSSGMRVRGKVVRLSIGDDLEAGIERSLDAVAGLPFVDSVLALPDLHQKAKMEVPSSIAIQTRGTIVPEFTSAAVNDGMGIVTTDLSVEDLSRDQLRSFLARVNSHAASHVFDTNRYSLSRKELLEVLVHGGGAVLNKYQLPDDALKRMEWDGRIPVDGDVFDVVPRQLLRTGFSRSEMGLNFGGNHFLEVQVVDEVLDRDVATRWGLTRGQIVVMYHLGPGPFSGTLLHHYSRRSKLQESRVGLFLLSKLIFHYMQRGGVASPIKTWQRHFRHNGWTPMPVDSKEGIAFRRALAMATNFGFAYRLATVRAIMDGLRETVSPGVDTRLLCDIAHNGIYEEPLGGGTTWVARHNSCRLAPGGPAIVAGSYDVPSYLGLGLDGMDGRLHSYDHGAGSIIDHYRDASLLGHGNGSVLRLQMTRGRKARVVAEREAPAKSSEPIDRLMGCLEHHRIVRPIVRLRPVANLKN